MFLNGGNLYRRRRVKLGPVVVMRPIGGGRFIKTLQYPHASGSMFALRVRSSLIAHLDASYDLLAYAPKIAHLDASYDLLVYKDVIAHLDASYDLNAFVQKVAHLDASYDLLACTPKVAHLDASYDLLGYADKVAHLDASYDLLAYQQHIQHLDASYDLNAFTQRVMHLDASYDLLSNEQFYTWMINLTTGAVSKADNYSFNSLSGNLGADSTGIHALTGTTDNGVAINGFVESGKMALSPGSNLTRAIDAYIGVDGGKLKLSVTDEKTGANAYNIAATSQLMTVKANLGRGCKGKYWAVKLENVAGSAAKVDSIELNAEVLARRV